MEILHVLGIVMVAIHRFTVTKHHYRQSIAGVSHNKPVRVSIVAQDFLASCGCALGATTLMACENSESFIQLVPSHLSQMVSLWYIKQYRYKIVPYTPEKLT